VVRTLTCLYSFHYAAFPEITKLSKIFYNKWNIHLFGSPLGREALYTIGWHTLKLIMCASGCYYSRFCISLFVMDTQKTNIVIDDLSQSQCLEIDRTRYDGKRADFSLGTPAKCV